MEVCPRLSIKRAYYNHRSSYKRAAKGSKSEKEDKMVEAKVGDICMYECRKRSTSQETCVSSKNGGGKKIHVSPRKNTGMCLPPETMGGL